MSVNAMITVSTVESERSSSSVSTQPSFVEGAGARAGDSFEPGAWSLGRHYKWINPLAVAWIALITILFLMPTVPTAIPWHSGFDWNVVNYAPITVGGVIALTGVWWLLSARKWFKGPVREGTDEELAQIEASFGGAGTPAAASPAGQA